MKMVNSLGGRYQGVKKFDASGIFKKLTKLVWEFDFKNKDYNLSRLQVFGIVGFAFVIWLFATPKAAFLFDPIVTNTVHIFHMVPTVDLSGESKQVGMVLIFLAFARFAFLIFVGLADIFFHKRATGKAFNWRGMVNISLANVMMWLFGFAFIAFNPYLDDFFIGYASLLASVPTLVEFNGPAAVIIACLIGDFCFYWSHRLTHNMRFLWNLGHINHHRHENLTQFHFAAEPDVFLLKASNGLALIMLPFLSALFSSDLIGIGWFLVAVIAIDIWIDPSHSPFLYKVEQKFKVLRALRWVFVTVTVHYTHHSKEPRHNKKTGCNFGARLTIWDRLFGTYVEPDDEIPETGLFGKHTDYCYNPVRFLLLPYVRFYKELKLNDIRFWPKILFGSVFYTPPNKSGMSH